LWIDGKKAGRYESIRDMARKLGISHPTLQQIIKAHEERRRMHVDMHVSYQDIIKTQPLADEPELRKQVLELREKGKIITDELRHFSKIIKEHPELAEYAIKLKEKGKPVDKIEKAVEFVATQPEDIKQEFVKAGIDVESMPVHHVAIDIPKEKAEEIKIAIEQAEEDQFN
jgi:transposase-like protein